MLRKDGKPLPHLHAVAGDSTFAAYGGHLLALEVGTGSMELSITLHAQGLQRQTDERPWRKHPWPGIAPAG